jgi:hypothetical protein
MEILKTAILIWMFFWFLCSAIYVVNHLARAKQTGIERTFSEIAFTSFKLFLIWPFTVFIYIYTKTKLNDKPS